MIEAISLELKNFRTWKNLKIDNLNNKGLCLIVGDNGSGKSSIRQAIEYLLTDTTSDNLPLEELSYNSDGNCMMKIVLKKEDSIIEITKYRDDSTHNNRTLLVVDGDDSLTASDRRITQKNIESVLGFTEKSLYSSSIFSGGTDSFIESKETDRKKLIYELYDLDKYNELAEIAKEITKDIETDIEKVKGEIESLVFKKESKEEFVEETVKLSNTFEEEKQNRILNLKQNIEKTKANIKDALHLENKLLTIKDAIEEFEDVSDALSETESDLDSVIFSENKAKTKLKSLYKNKSSEEEGDCICPIIHKSCEDLCDFREEKLNHINSEIEKLEKEVELESSKEENLRKEIDELQKQHFRYKDLLSRKEELERKIDDIIYHNNRYLSEIKDLENRIEQEKLSENAYLNKIKSLEKEISELSRAIDNSLQKLSMMEESYPYYKFWVTGFGKGGIPNLKAERFLLLIEENTNKILSSVKDRMSISISSQSEIKSGKKREKISYRINHPDKSISSYESYSGGEKQRIKIADIFAFSFISRLLDMVILDEVLDLSLDSKGIDEVIEILKKVSNEFGSVFVISHNSQLQDYFENKISISKANGKSEIDEFIYKRKI